MDAFRSITYVSTEKNGLTLQELNSLVQQSKHRNFATHVTGILLRCEGRFLQCLEGSSSDVSEIYESICKDKRHHSILCLSDNEICERSFGTWAMAYAEVPMLDFRQLLSASWTAPDAAPADGSVGKQLLQIVWEQYPMKVARIHQKPTI